MLMMLNRADDAITILPHPFIQVVREYCEKLNARASQSTGQQKNKEEKI